MSDHCHHLAVHPTKLERSIAETQTALPWMTFFAIKRLSSEWYERNRLSQAHWWFILCWELANNDSALICTKKKKINKSYRLDKLTAEQHPTPVAGMSVPVRLYSSALLFFTRRFKQKISQGQGRLSTRLLLLTVNKRTERMLSLNRLQQNP